VKILHDLFQWILLKNFCLLHKGIKRQDAMIAKYCRKYESSDRIDCPSGETEKTAPILSLK